MIEAAPVPGYTKYAGCAITAAIPVKFGTAHGRSRPDVGSAKCIDAYGRNVISALLSKK